MAEIKYPLALVVRAVDKLTAPLNAMNERMTKFARPMNVGLSRLSNRITALGKAAGIPAVAKGFQSVHASAGKVSEEAGALAAKLAGIGLAGGGAMYALVRSAEAAGSRLEDLSAQTGLNVNAYAQLEFAAKRGGVENEAFAAGMNKFNKSLSEAKRGTGPLAALLDKVGPAYLKQLKAVQSTEGGFNLLVAAMGKIEDPGKRAELAAAAFGKAGVGMAAALAGGPDAVEALRAEFRNLAGDQTKFTEGAGELGDAFDNMEVATLGLRNALGGALFPAFQKLAEAVTGFLAKNRDGLAQWAKKTGDVIQGWVDGGGVERLAATLSSLAATVGNVVDKLGGVENVVKLVALAMSAKLIVATGDLIVSVGKLVVALVPAIAKLGVGLVAALGQAALAMLSWNFAPMLAGLGSLATATWAWTAALLANPLTWIVLAVVAAVALLAGAAYLIYKNWEPISKWFKALWGDIVKAHVDAWNSVKAFVTEMWDGLVSRVKSAYEKIKPILEAIKTVMGYTPIGLAVRGTMYAAEQVSASGSAPALSAAAAAPASRGGDAKVVVDFVNAPRGTRVTPAADNTAEVDWSLGLTMGPT